MLHNQYAESESKPTSIRQHRKKPAKRPKHNNQKKKKAKPQDPNWHFPPSTMQISHQESSMQRRAKKKKDP